MACPWAANSITWTRAPSPPRSAAGPRFEPADSVACPQNSQDAPALGSAPARLPQIQKNQQGFGRCRSWPAPCITVFAISVSLTVLNEIAGAPEIPAPGLHYYFRHIPHCILLRATTPGLRPALKSPSKMHRCQEAARVGGPVEMCNLLAHERRRSIRQEFRSGTGPRQTGGGGRARAGRQQSRSVHL